MSTDRFSTRIGMLLEASNVKKSMVIPYFLTVVFVQYFLFDCFFINYPTRYLNIEVLQNLRIFHIALITVTIGMILAKHRLEQSSFAQRTTPYVFSFFYITTLTSLGYAVGHMSIVTGMVIAAAPLFAIVLFERNVIIFIIVTGVICLSTVCTLYVIGILPYAPMFNEVAPDQLAKEFYLGCMLFLAAPHMIGMLLITYLLVTYWRSREEDIRRMSLTDSLIGMANRRAISNHLSDVKDKQVHQKPLSIILVDIDYFKKINDTFGHIMGDMVLCRVGDCLQLSLRNGDQVGRYGGEEFLIVLPDTSLASAAVIAERCRYKLENEIIWSNDNQRINVTASFGVYCAENSSEDILSMIQQVDTQLYRAKENGRNKVCTPETLISTSMQS